MKKQQLIIIVHQPAKRPLLPTWMQFILLLAQLWINRPEPPPQVRIWRTTLIVAGTILIVAILTAADMPHLIPNILRALTSLWLG
ncbi:MAG: hypothetical protein KDE56_03005 [Anaerolineales bacterium]|nr:hypothetical protein [Anaerolineales bacterium]